MDPELDIWHMSRALELAARGQGAVEPNPMVGCVIVKDGHVVGEGYHRKYGGPHAEVEALASAGPRAAGATMLVTLEPCCHFGKTPPCTQAVIAAGIRRVVVAQEDPFPEVSGRGIAELRAAGIEVEVGTLRQSAIELNAPYLKLLRTGRPWITAKWAMTLDGKIAGPTGDSKWISSPASRAIVHALRGRVDAVLVGRGTVAADDPLLTARPAGPRTATRIMLDSSASLRLDSQLVRTVAEAPVLVVTTSEAPQEHVSRLEQAGCEVLKLTTSPQSDRMHELLDQLGRRRMTNVLVEGGSEVLGALFDLAQVDEVHAFVAPAVLGGALSKTPVAGAGRNLIANAHRLVRPMWRQLESDLYLHAYCEHAAPA